VQGAWQRKRTEGKKRKAHGSRRTAKGKKKIEGERVRRSEGGRKLEVESSKLKTDERR
jgi:hypothetical protein